MYVILLTKKRQKNILILLLDDIYSLWKKVNSFVKIVKEFLDYDNAVKFSLVQLTISNFSDWEYDPSKCSSCVKVY